MEVYGVDKKLSELGESDFNELLDTDMFIPITDHSNSDHFPHEWLTSLFEDPVLLHDKMMIDAEQSPHVQVEHSYSLAMSESGSPSPLDSNFKLDDYKDLESECFPSMPMDTLHLPICTPVVLKKEPSNSKISSPPCVNKPQQQQLHQQQQPMIVVNNQVNSRQQRLVLPKVNIKVEPTDIYDQNHNFDLPPTPPSSSNSDSESCQSPTHSVPSSPPSSSPIKQSSRTISQNNMRSSIRPAISNQNTQSTGVLILTEEEKRTLLAEGYPVPSKLPLTKAEEKSLKKIRRKIKNKISAQESRRKKKEYLDALEKRVEAFSSENNDLKKKMDNLESNNKSLLSQLQKLQALAGKITKSYRTASTQTCLMVLILCFAVILGPWSPNFLSSDKHSIMPSLTISMDNNVKLFNIQHSRGDAYTTPNKRSRMLLSYADDDEDFTSNAPYGPPLSQHSHSPLLQKKNQLGGKKSSSPISCQPLVEPKLVALTTGLESDTLQVDNIMVQEITSNIVTTEPRINATE